MKNKLRRLLDEFKIIGIAFIFTYLFFQIHYFRENFFVILKAVFAHFYLFIVPGYSLCLIFCNKFDRIERLIIGIGIGYALQPFILYLINFIVGINILKYNLFVSGAMIALGAALFYSCILEEK